jgi:hypothetical protein
MRRNILTSSTPPTVMALVVERRSCLRPTLSYLSCERLTPFRGVVNLLNRRTLIVLRALLIVTH